MAQHDIFRQQIEQEIRNLIPFAKETFSLQHGQELHVVIKFSVTEDIQIREEVYVDRIYDVGGNLLAQEIDMDDLTKLKSIKMDLSRFYGHVLWQVFINRSLGQRELSLEELCFFIGFVQKPSLLYVKPLDHAIDEVNNFLGQEKLPYRIIRSISGPRLTYQLFRMVQKS
ncbi:MAG: hypothetical protein G01um101466_227 [Parcubacteria group bacterium Gr01-1014_66]|nr:MAG: hypothetical protein G01um101466_227 [Parcubacteria group bacterium Gr01-1014_66]